MEQEPEQPHLTCLLVSCGLINKGGTAKSAGNFVPDDDCVSFFDSYSPIAHVTTKTRIGQSNVT